MSTLVELVHEHGEDLLKGGGIVTLFVGSCRWVRNVLRHEVSEIVDEKLAPIHHELRPNSGKSLRDRVDLIEREQSEMRVDVSTIRGQVTELLGHARKASKDRGPFLDLLLRRR